MPTEKNDIAILVGSAIFILVFVTGIYLRQLGNDSTKMMQEKQPLLDVQLGSVSGKINKNSTALDRQPGINGDRLLDEISAIIPKTVQLTVLERGDSSQLFLEGRALSADAIYDFVDTLNANRHIELTELNPIRIGKWNSQNVLIFSISCSLVSDTNPPLNDPLGMRIQNGSKSTS